MSYKLALPAHITLSNGLTLIHQQQPHMGVVAIDVWVKAGAIFEPDAWSGMAHFLEHMIFKGSERVHPGMFDQAVEGHGGSANAGTGYDYAHYHMVMARQHFAATLPYLAEILVHAAIPDDCFDAERQVVFEELRQCWDNPDYVAFQELGEKLYNPHGYARPILGTPETLAGISPDMMRQFHRAFYQPENMTIVVVGDIDRDSTIALIEQHFSQFAPPANLPPYQSQPAAPFQQPQQQQIQLPQLEESRLIFSWLTPGWGQNTAQTLHQGYCFDLLSVVLASGRSSRLIQQLLETEELVYDIDASFSLQRDAGLFSVTAWLPDAHIPIVTTALREQFHDFAMQPISPGELRRAQNLLCNEAAFSTELPEQTAGVYGYYNMIGNLSAAWEYPRTIQTIDADQIQAVAQQQLTLDRALTTTVQPQN